MKLFTTIAAAAVTLTSFAIEPANAGGIRWPSLAGAEFCSLRRIGADFDSAIKGAMADGYDPNWTETVYIKVGGESYSKGYLDFYRHITTACPEFANREDAI